MSSGWNRTITWVWVVAVVGLGAASSAQPSDQPAAEGAATAPAATDATARFIRVVEQDEGRRLLLQLSIRDYARPGADGPVVSMAGAVHIADRAFYEALQKELDAKDVVLFEGVKPAGVGRAEHDLEGADDQARAEATRKRLRLLAGIVEAYRRQHGALPATLDALAGESDRRIAWLVATARRDGWSRDLVYTVAAPGPEGGGPSFDLVSLGADGAPGGEGAAADLAFSQQRPLSKEEIPGDAAAGIQEQLAGALELVFQLKAMDHSGPNWRNSDLSVDQVQARLEQAGADSAMLFRMLDGSSFQAQLAGLALRLVGMMPSVSAMFKMMMVDMLAHADEMFAQLPGQMGAMMQVIVTDRNAVVIDDLRRVIEQEPQVRTVGIIYGAGHLPDLERRLRDDLGLEFTSARWNTAIEVDTAQTGMSPREVANLRRMMDRMIRQQVKAMQQQQQPPGRRRAP